MEIPESNRRTGSDGRTINTVNIGRKPTPRVDPPRPPSAGAYVPHPPINQDTVEYFVPLQRSAAEMELQNAISHAWSILGCESTPSEMAQYLTREQNNIISDVRLWAEDLQKLYKEEE
jgi:hypothetical protein